MEVERPAWNPIRQCTATNRAGQRCQRNAIPGGFVCVLHGGKAPAVQQSARARLAAGAEPAIDYLLGCFKSRPPCPHCGRSDADRDPVVVRAAQIVLDRAGFHPTLQINMQPADNKFANLTTDELIAHLEEMLANAIEVRDQEQRQLPPATEAVVADGIELPEDEPIPSEIGTPDKRTDEIE